MSRQRIIDWLAGELPSQKEKVQQVADALGVPFEVLWGDAADVTLSERTRLMQLERVVRELYDLLTGVVPETETAPAASREPTNIPYAEPTKVYGAAKGKGRKRTG